MVGHFYSTTAVGLHPTPLSSRGSDTPAFAGGDADWYRRDGDLRQDESPQTRHDDNDAFPFLQKPDRFAHRVCRTVL
jgi:hypothetical protein